MQRTLDIFFCVFLLITLMPLLILILPILRFTGEGEVFYTQYRIGRNGKSFKLLKFATMLKNSPNMDTGNITVKNDKRVLPFGKLLRKTKINELPQLFNVLCGDMSLIGPRPLTKDLYELYPTNTQRIISQVRPGLSGVGSIIFRDEEGILAVSEDSIKFYEAVIGPHKAELEQWYCLNNSIRNYFLLLFLTIYVVFIPNSCLIRSVFRSLPPAPRELLALTKA